MTVREILEIAKDNQEIEFVGTYPYKVVSLLDSYGFDTQTTIAVFFQNKQDAKEFFEKNGHLDTEPEKVEIFSKSVVLSIKDFISANEIQEIKENIEVKQFHLEEEIRDLYDLIAELEGLE